MDKQFLQHIESLPLSFDSLRNCPTFQVAKLPKNLPKAGIYLFSDGGRDVYVGRTNCIRERLQQHCRPSSSHNSATFAFRLARESCNSLQASYTTQGSRAKLLEKKDFTLAFNEAKTRLRTMSIRVVEESNSLRQALLEMYVAVALATPYNDFDNH